MQETAGVLTKLAAGANPHNAEEVIISIPSDSRAPDWVWLWLSSQKHEEFRAATLVPSNEINTVFRLDFDTQTLFLKIGPDLLREYERLQWLESRQPCPRPIGFLAKSGTDALLMSALEGNGLASLSSVLPPHTIVTRLVQALKALHATDIADWPFGGSGSTLVHGDACLPNFLFCSDRLCGYIDIGDMRLAEPEVDLAAAVWSLQYNLGPGYGLAFLREYGITDAEEADVERLRQQYEDS